ncbi:hypothetical protein WDU94_000201 [Cyamophila willieti]
MDFVSTGGGSLVDNIFLVFNAYDWWVYYSKKEEKNLAKKEREEKIQDVPAIIEPEPVPYVPFEPPRSEPIDIPAPKYRQHWKTNIDYEETPPRRRRRCAIKSHLVLDSSYRIKMCHQEPSCSRLILPHQDVPSRAILFSTHPTVSRCAIKSHLVLDSSYRIKMCHQEPSCSRLILPHQDVPSRAILFSTHPTDQDVPSRAILFSTHPTASRCAIKSHLVLDSSYRIKMCHQEPSCSRLILPHQDVPSRAILPDIYGKELVSLLSSILSNYADSNSHTLPVTLCLESIHVLCQAGVVDFASVWTTLSVLRHDTRPRVLIGLISLMECGAPSNELPSGTVHSIPSELSYEISSVYGPMLLGISVATLRQLLSGLCLSSTSTTSIR